MFNVSKTFIQFMREPALVGKYYRENRMDGTNTNTPPVGFPGSAQDWARWQLYDPDDVLGIERVYNR